VKGSSGSTSGKTTKSSSAQTAEINSSATKDFAATFPGRCRQIQVYRRTSEGSVGLGHWVSAGGPSGAAALLSGAPSSRAWMISRWRAEYFG
jgi:hypothetical protein